MVIKFLNTMAADPAMLGPSRFYEFTCPAFVIFEVQKLVVVALVFLNELFGSVFILDDAGVGETRFDESVVADCHYATPNNLVAIR